MRWAIGTVITCMFAVSLVCSALGQTISATYALAGKNFDGSSYTGTVQIIPNGSTCRIVWHTGTSTSEGLCMLSGNTLAAFYKLGVAYGLVIYERQPDGSFQGHWSVADKQGVGTELLVPQK
jgi:hypothetical protein